MPLAAGVRLGPYEIVAPLGAGGMGEVYRARDTRLQRDVAVKVLPPGLAGDEERLRRFEQEARATGALNHPNILAVFDIGSDAVGPYVVSELLEGQTLREALGPLPPRKALDYGAQIARGLAAAHEKGIVHRDLKPENLFVTRDGRVKILDFGLARVIRVEASAQQGSEAATLSQHTEPGKVLGTAGYMSPEQVRGLPTDHRSDIFSLGAVLYEMLSGQRAFHGATPADTMIAILKEDPPELPVGRAGLPPALDRIVRHCLEKAPEQRFQSARDVAFDLESVSSLSGTSAGAPGLQTMPRRPWPRTIAVSGLALAALAGAFVGGRMTAQRPVPTIRPMTFRAGYVTSARFAPDGRTAVYGAAWDGGPVELHSVRPESPESKPLGLPPAGILAISSSGQMAVSRGCQFMEGAGACRGTLAVVPLTGGAPRDVLEDVVGADWSPDGKDLAVARITGGRFRLEFPLGTLLYESSGYLIHPRVSPRGDLVAFIEHTQGAGPGGAMTGAVTVVNSKGFRRVLASGFLWGSGLAWSPDGREVWFSGRFGAVGQIHAVTLRGRERLVDMALGRLADIGPQGQALLVRGPGSRMGLVGQAPGETRERNLSWFDYTVPADLSADGRTILFGERLAGTSGPQFGVYLRQTDGSPAVRLADGTAVALSPDGKWALSRTAPDQMMLLPTGAGSSRALPRGPVEEYAASGCWMPDSRQVLFEAREHGHEWRTYTQDLETGEIRAVTPEGVGGHVVSPDGRFIAAAKPDQPFALYPLDGGPPRGIPGMGPDDEPVRWNRDGRALFVVRRKQWNATLFRVEIPSGQRQLLREFRPADPAGIIGFADFVLVDADARSYVYSFNRVVGQLVLAEGLR
jgi:Tol biopolymer transport system component